MYDSIVSSSIVQFVSIREGRACRSGLELVGALESGIQALLLYNVRRVLETCARNPSHHKMYHHVFIVRSSNPI